MFLGIVTSAGLFLGPMTAALLGSDATLPRNDLLNTECSSRPSVAWEQVFLLLSSGGKELFSETLEALAVSALMGTRVGLECLFKCCSPS